MRSSGGHGLCRKERVRCAIYTRKSSDEGLEQGSSIRCRRSARPAKPSSPASATRAGVCLRAGHDDGGVLRRDHGSARSATAARRYHGGSRIRDKIRGIVADFITGGAVLE